MSFLYFAYGSNMLPARLAAPKRCPSAKVIGLATAPDHGMEFSKRSKDGSGKATLISATDIHTPGVLFEIARSELRDLDRAEGAGYGYDRHDGFKVRLATADTVTVTTYIATKTDAALKPFDWYLALVLAGAHHHELETAHVDMLRAIEYVIDSDREREGRIDALAALKDHGFDDHNSLLTGK